jgi:hypothetical protein
MFSPRSVDAKSLALRKLMVEKIRREPALFDCVQLTLDRWHHETLMGKRPYFVAWQALVYKGMEATLALAVEVSERGQSMRQASPFAGILTEGERQDFLAAWSAARDHRS